MTLLGFVVLVCVAGVCRAIAGYTHVGCLGSIALGFIGALVGTLIARELRLPYGFALQMGHESFPVLWSIAGSAIFVAVLSIFTRRQPEP